MRYFLFFFVTIFSIFAAEGKEIGHKEAFDPSLKRLNTIDLLNGYIDSCAAALSVPANSRKEVFLINDVIEKKFYHGYSHYTKDDNFLAYLAGQYVWDHLSAIVIANDVVKQEMAACSQQAIVMMKILKLRGYKVRELGLTGHYVLEVFYDNGWHFFDPNKEPIFQGIHHDSLSYLLANGILTKSYSNNLSEEEVKVMFSTLKPGETNAVPAQKARLFHFVTKFVSKNFLLIITGSVMLLTLIWKKNKSQKKSKQLAQLQRRRVMSREPASLSRKVPLAN